MARIGVVLVCVVVAACSRSQVPGGKEEAAAPAASVSARARPTAPPYPTAVPIPTQRYFQLPSGPVLAVLPGRGLGPIRFGATVATIERHMEMPCDAKTETLCRYRERAVDFHLADGVLRRVEVQGDERPYGDKEQTYGVFNGLLLGGAQLGMYRNIVIEEFGEPDKTELSPEPGNPVRRDSYDGVVLEYDKLHNGNVVLAGIVVTPSKTAKDNYLTATRPR